MKNAFFYGIFPCDPPWGVRVWAQWMAPPQHTYAEFQNGATIAWTPGVGAAPTPPRPPRFFVLNFIGTDKSGRILFFQDRHSDIIIKKREEDLGRFNFKPFLITHESHVPEHLQNPK